MKDALMHTKLVFIVAYIFLNTTFFNTSCTMNLNASRPIQPTKEETITFSAHQMKMIGCVCPPELPCTYKVSYIKNTTTQIHQRLCSFNQEKKRPEIVYAASIGAFEIVQALLLCEIDPNVHVDDRYGSTALVDAIIGGFFDVVAILLGYGADSMLNTLSGYSPMDTTRMNLVEKRFIDRGREKNEFGGKKVY